MSSTVSAVSCPVAIAISQKSGSSELARCYADLSSVVEGNLPDGLAWWVSAGYEAQYFRIGWVGEKTISFSARDSWYEMLIVGKEVVDRYSSWDSVL